MYTATLSALGEISSAVLTTTYFLLNRLYFTLWPLSAWILNELARRTGIGSKFIRQNPALCLITSSLCLIITIIWTGTGIDQGNSLDIAAGSLAFFALGGVYMISARLIDRFPADLDETLSLVASRWPERSLSRILKYPQDAYFVRFMINNTLVILPAWSAVLFVDFGEVQSFFYVTFFWVGTGMVQSHETLDHTNIHNRLFRVRDPKNRLHRTIGKSLDGYLTWILNPLCLRIPNFYRIQHLYVHHAEDNGPKDAQSTLHYDRASYLDFCRSSAKVSFSFAFGLDVLSYLVKRQKYGPAKSLCFGVTAWHCLLLLLLLLNWQGAMMVFILKLMRGIAINTSVYSWHGLVDIEQPRNVYRNSVNMKLTRESVFGGAYHIEHHLDPGRRWHDIAGLARMNERQHLDNDAIDLWKEGWFGFMFMKLLWLRRFDVLASRSIRMGWRSLSVAEAAEVIRRRTLPLVPRERSPLVTRLDERLGRFVASWLILERLDLLSLQEAEKMERERDLRLEALSNDEFGSMADA